MFFYFLAGFLTIGMIFLAVALVPDSMQEAQAYLMPVSMLIAAPSVALASVISRDPNGLVPRIVAWIPIYTPVVMLARLQSGVSSLDLFGTAAVLVLFGVVELLVLARLFESNLIQTGRGFHLPVGRRRIVVAALAVTVAVVAITVRRSRAPSNPADQSAALLSRGESLFRAYCATCHDPAVGRAPGRQQLASLTPADVVKSLTTGTMKPMAAGLDSADGNALALYLTGRQLKGPAVAIAVDPPPCPRNPGTFLSVTPGGWSGWERHRPAQLALSARARPFLPRRNPARLKVKWSFAYPGGEYGQPTVVGGRVFLSSRGGAIYSLDARTGCLYWRFAQPTPSRTTISIGPLPGVARSGYAAYFGDTGTNVYAVDAATGDLLWKTRVDSHPRAMLTGSPALFRDRLYVPVSSYEELTASLAAYSCCTFRGNVVALDAATGKIAWKAYAIDGAPAPTKKNSAGTQMYGPAGAAVWSAPTIDAKRNRLYFATGNSYTDAQEDGSDAVIAVDLETGHTIWRRQVTENDDDLSGCTSGRKLVNCPSTRGHDYDFGSSPILLTLPDGRDILTAGQKSGTVFGIDPASGVVLWRTQVGAGGFLGGILWGMAADARYLYVANADVVVAGNDVAGNGRPGLFALNPATGKDIWYTPAPRVPCSWTSGAPCFNAQSAAPTAIPGAVFAGTTDGHERAYAAADGRVLWDFDTGRPSGGAIDVSSGSLANGMLFLISGYRGVLGGSSDNVLLAFSVDGR